MTEGYLSLLLISSVHPKLYLHSKDPNSLMQVAYLIEQNHQPQLLDKPPTSSFSAEKNNSSMVGGSSK